MRRTFHTVQHETSEGRAPAFVSEEVAWAVADVLEVTTDLRHDVVVHEYGRSPRLDAHAELIHLGEPPREAWRKMLKPPPRLTSGVRLRRPRRGVG